jgi:hypothetical protein
MRKKEFSLNAFPVIKPFSELGREPNDDGTGSDASFYEWMKGDDEEKTVAEFLRYLIDDLREEHDPAKVKEFLDDWHARLPREEFFERLGILSKLMPPMHAFHQVKLGYG